MPETRHDLVDKFGRPQDEDDLDKISSDQLADVAEAGAGCPAHQPNARFRVDQVHADRGGIKEGFEPRLAVPQRRFCALTLGNVVKALISPVTSPHSFLSGRMLTMTVIWSRRAARSAQPRHVRFLFCRSIRRPLDIGRGAENYRLDGIA